jgi:hypothetical protein
MKTTRYDKTAILFRLFIYFSFSKCVIQIVMNSDASGFDHSMPINFVYDTKLR